MQECRRSGRPLAGIPLHCLCCHVTKVTPTGSDEGGRCRVKTTPTPMKEFSVVSQRLHTTAKAMRLNIPIAHRQQRTRLTSRQPVENHTDSDIRVKCGVQPLKTNTHIDERVLSVVSQ